MLSNAAIKDNEFVMNKTISISPFIISALTNSSLFGRAPKEFFTCNSLLSLLPVSEQNESFGVTGPFVGVHNDVLIIAGGTNFPNQLDPTFQTDFMFVQFIARQQYIICMKQIPPRGGHLRLCVVASNAIVYLLYKLENGKYRSAIAAMLPEYDVRHEDNGHESIGILSS